jgi:hypothetical protein
VTLGLPLTLDVVLVDGLALPDVLGPDDPVPLGDGEAPAPDPGAELALLADGEGICVGVCDGFGRDWPGSGMVVVPWQPVPAVVQASGCPAISSTIVTAAIPMTNTTSAARAIRPHR